MKKNACPEGGRGEGPGQPETAEKHGKCLQKRRRQVKAFTRRPSLFAAQGCSGGPRRLPAPPRHARWGHLGNLEEARSGVRGFFSTAGNTSRSASAH